MKLVNMKESPRDATQDMPVSSSADTPAYPWGLRLRLEDEQLRKLLGDAGALPPAGTACILSAKAEVVSSGKFDSQDGGERLSLELQVTDLGFAIDTSDDEDQQKRAGKLYGKGTKQGDENVSATRVTQDGPTPKTSIVPERLYSK